MPENSRFTTAGPEIWRPEDGHDLEIFATSIKQKQGKSGLEPEFLDFVDSHIDQLSDELRTLSLDIHGKQARTLHCRTA